MASSRNRRAPTRVSSTSRDVRVVGDMVQRDPRAYHQPRSASPFAELGTSGLKQYGGWIYDEWLNALQGREAAWRWREVLDNSPLVGGFLFLIETLAKRATWSATDGEAKWQEHVHQSMFDMSRPWGDFLSEALTFLPYGYAPCEEVFKRREGHRPESYGMLGQGDPETTEESDTLPSSQYADGLIGWRKLPLRAQETTLHWDFDGYSKLRGLIQLDWHGGERFIPITKLALFRFRPVRGNPEGTSILRKAWTSHVRLSVLQDIEAVGAARDLAGIPMIEGPETVDIFGPGEREKELYEKAKQLVTTIHRDEDEGVVMPFGWKLSLLSSGGSRQFDTNEIIRRYEQRIAASFLSDFMLLGQDGLGSYAMVDVKSEIFGNAVNAVFDMICETLNRFSVPRLLALNGVRGANLPQITHTSASRVDLEKIGSFLYNMSAAGAPIDWNPKMIKQLFDSAGLPVEMGDRLPPKKPEGATPAAQPVKKAEGEEESEAERAEREATERAAAAAGVPATLSTAYGTAIMVGPLLGAQVAALAVQLEREIVTAFGLLALALATAYTAFVTRNPEKWLERKQLANRVLSVFDLKRWVSQHLEPVMRNQASRVVADVLRNLSGAGVTGGNVDEKAYTRMARHAMDHLRKTDLEPQLRTMLNRILEDAFERGENPDETARTIQKMVPAGRWVNAGPEFRARLIARTVTAELARETTLAAYSSMSNVNAIRIRDGIYGPPRSCPQCIARDGDVVPIADAGSIRLLHPQCTLQLEPVIA